MAKRVQRSEELWALAERQHGVVSRRQLLELELSSSAIEHRLAIGRLHPLWRGVYAVGRPSVTRDGIWIAATLACGPAAMLSDGYAGALWEMHREVGPLIEVTVPGHVYRRRPGIVVHRRRYLRSTDVDRRRGIPVTSPLRTLIDLATRLRSDELEAAVNEADRLDLIDPERLRAQLADRPGLRGVRTLRELLDRQTLTLTDSELERRFLPIARRAGLPQPLTQQWVNGFRVDFFWPELGLVVETDGLRYHRTPAEQANDRLRDQAHTSAGLTTLRFTHSQVVHHPAYVARTLAKVARRLAAERVPIAA